MLRRFLRFLLGLALLPLACGVTLALLDALYAIPLRNGFPVSPEALSLFAGIVVFLAVWMLLPSPARVYVLGHELTHALWGLAFGAKVSNLKVAADGGSVLLTKTNIWITLAPYFFPFYTVLVVIAALVTRCFVSPLPHPCLWTFAVGVTWCFHVCFTFQSLLQHQPDIQECGHVLSYVLIYTLNLAGVLLWIAATTELSFLVVLRFAAIRTGAAYSAVAAFSFAAMRRLLLYFKP